MIDKSWRPRLYAYLGGILKSLGGIPQAVRGVSDHVHLLVGLKATHCLADTLREVKSVSSLWVHNEIQFPRLRGRRVTERSLLVPRIASE